MKARAAPGRGGLTRPAAAALKENIGLDEPTSTESLARHTNADKSVVVVTVRRAGRVEYRLATEPAHLPESLPSDCDSTSITLLPLGWCDPDLQLLIAGLAEDRAWFGLDDLYRHLPLGVRGGTRATRRRVQGS